MGLRDRFRRTRRGVTPADMERAEAELDRARAQRAEQAGKRHAERGRLITPMERFAEENHLSALVVDVVTGIENGGQQ